ncbi:MAG TPA: nuclear transport factor 2 family protein [Acidimicrobiales bacterium]|jgi:hypothetical protein|nr:nuclear transport factor 2 family protein [Acidimicrobiales bacterium]
MIGTGEASEQELRDELALRALSTSYAAAADLRDGDRFAALFVEDGELVVPDYPVDFRPVLTRAGRERLRLIPGFLRQYPITFHQVTNQEFAVDGDTAHGDVQCVAHHLTAVEPTVPSAPTLGAAADGPTKPEGSDFIWYIRYRDDYQRVDGDWKFRRRSIHLQFVEERPVLRMGPPVS